VLSFDLYDRGGSRLDHPSRERHTGELFVDQVRELWETVVVAAPAADKGDHDGDDDEKEEEKRPHHPVLRKDSFTLVGHSMGGAVSLLFAHRYPDLVPVLDVDWLLLHCHPHVFFLLCCCARWRSWC
jgi:pimeloyl-ACP methyl ester carboxylesterase